MVRRGSIGDDSDNDFSDVAGDTDTDTDTGSGVTGDTGADTSFGGSGTDDRDVDDDDFGGDFSGGDFDPNPSDREVGGTDDNDLSDVGGDTGGDSTGGSNPSRREIGAGSGQDLSDVGGGQGLQPEDAAEDVPDDPAEDMDSDPVNRRPGGTSVTRFRGDTAITGAPLPFQDTRQAGGSAASTAGFAGERFVDAGGRDRAPTARPASGGGETFVDARLAELERTLGIDAPVEGDVVQRREDQLEELSAAIREGRTFLPSPNEAERFGRRAAATTVSGDTEPVRIGDATLDREEAARNFGGRTARLTAEALNLPQTALSTGRTVEVVGETGFNLAAGFGGQALSNPNLNLLDPAFERDLSRAGQAAGERGREQIEAAALGVPAATEQAIEDARDNPAAALGAAGFFAGSALAGTGATRAATRVPDVLRTARVRAAADDTVDFEDITTEDAAETGALPEFETDPSAPTGEAVAEVRERAVDNPDEITEAVDEDAALFQSTEADLGAGFEARRGSSELPGLFTSPDASPLRLNVGSETSLLSTDIRLPRPSDFRSQSDRVAAFPGDRIEGFPDDATGSGRVPDGEGGFEPDPGTSGAEFLDESAEEGTAFVRPQGGRTAELESIFPPGTEFSQTGKLAVELPSGRAVPLDVFRRADDVPDLDDRNALRRFLDDERGRVGAGDDTLDVGDTRTVEEIEAELRRLQRRDDSPDGDPATPPATPSGGSPTSGPPSAGDTPPSSPASDVSAPPSSGPGAPTSDAPPSGSPPISDAPPGSELGAPERRRPGSPPGSPFGSPPGSPPPTPSGSTPSDPSGGGPSDPTMPFTGSPGSPGITGGPPPSTQSTRRDLDIRFDSPSDTVDRDVDEFVERFAAPTVQPENLDDLEDIAAGLDTDLSPGTTAPVRVELDESVDEAFAEANEGFAGSFDLDQQGAVDAGLDDFGSTEDFDQTFDDFNGGI